MGQKKLVRFAAIKEFENVLENPQGVNGKWNAFFKNDNPVVLELACGKGEYANGLGKLHSEKNFIGVDIKGNRIWRGAKNALDAGLTNVAFLRTQIDRITEYFNKDEVSEIWITFPDPQLRFSKIKKRLTHPKFLRMYQQFLKAGGIIHLKTDSPDLYNFTKTVINYYGISLLQDEDDLYANQLRSEALKIKTHYERLDIAQSNRIHYLQFKLDKDFAVERDNDLKNLLAADITGIE